ncbi:MULTISPECIES: nuclear transport factor 2 family protein [unclassified Streptomyces]|uniref:nuclear transport factor 2 family protein n=1 Tax=unclassified Streptomyces TaxID=2593676 RepID=UPI00224CD711|nr:MULTISPECIES: nuclear transport factor 2 family protein [unclassified Streptomyces]MCX4529048.1 nuclear transport factor 2 family protein [Streptomyces sp. NBC_01551]MCX4540269.1 nuclear transport factor 2 family protein [Streptomyces sp. NBC_01565]
MTQRVDLATVMDRLAIDEVVSGYAVAVDDGDWDAYRALFVPSGRADYSSAGGIEGPAVQVADWLEQTMRLFPVRQHLIVNRLIRLEDLGGSPGDSAEVRADFVNPMRLSAAGSGDDGAAAPNFVAAGRYTFALARTRDGWRLSRVTVHEKWRHLSG